MNIQKQIFKRKKFICFFLLFSYISSINSTSLHFEGGSGKIVNTTTNALNALSLMKKNYDFKNGTQILVHNKTLKELIATDFYSSCGQFYTYPINVPSKQTLVFFHVSTNNITNESVGKVVFQERECKTKHTIWWDIPWFGETTHSPNGAIISEGTPPLLHFVIEPHDFVED